MLLSLKLVIAGGSFIAFNVILGFLAFEHILEFGLRDQTGLRKRNEVRSIYLKLPFPLDFRVYFFNVTNPMEVQNGATPILEEIGPYCYDEYVEKIDVVDNEGDDSLTYSPYHVFKFNQEKSGNLTDDDSVTMLHPLIIGMVNQVAKDSPALLSIVNKALQILFSDSQSVYLTTKVKEILFDGTAINCKQTEFAAKAVCTQLKSRVPGLKITDNEVVLFSLLGPRNATAGKRIKISRGIKDSKKLGKLLEIDGKRELNIWGAPECNAFKGTDGWIFPPLLNPEDGLWSYSADLCRSVGATYIEDTVMKGLDVRRYEIDLGDTEHNEDEKCFCSTPKTCLKKGVFDLSKCIGVPVYATLPHFLRTDESYSTQVIGLKPDLEKHIIKIFFEPMTSVPLEVKIRMQLNFPIAPNDKITLMKTLPNVLHPILWIERSIELEGPLLNKLKNIFSMIEIVKILRWVGICFGILMICYGGYNYFKYKDEVKITPIHQSEKVSRGTDEGRYSSGQSDYNKSEIALKKAKSVLSGHEFERY